MILNHIQHQLTQIIQPTSKSMLSTLYRFKFVALGHFRRANVGARHDCFTLK